MTLSMRKWTLRRMTHAAAVSAIALLLLGSGTGTTRAAPRQTASQAISDCQRQGGSAYYFSYWDIWAVGCSVITVNGSASGDDPVIDSADPGKTDAPKHKRHQSRKHQQHATTKPGHKHR